MKKRISLLLTLCLLLSAITCLAITPTHAETEAVVYISDSGDDLNSGKTPDAPKKTWKNAIMSVNGYSKMDRWVFIVVGSASYTSDDIYNFAGHNSAKPVIIRGYDDNCNFIYTRQFALFNDMTFENIAFVDQLPSKPIVTKSYTLTLSDKTPSVFLDGTDGSDDNSGFSMQSPIASLTKANTLLGATGGNIVLLKNYDYSAKETGNPYDIPLKQASHYTISGLTQDVQFIVSRNNLRIKSNITFSNITIQNAAWASNFNANGYTLEFTETVKTLGRRSGSAYWYVTVFGGCGDGDNTSSHIMINGGTWGEIVAGGKGKNITGNATVEIGGTAKISKLYLGGATFANNLCTASGSVGSATLILKDSATVSEIDCTGVTGTVLINAKEFSASDADGWADGIVKNATANTVIKTWQMPIVKYVQLKSGTSATSEKSSVRILAVIDKPDDYKEVGFLLSGNEANLTYDNETALKVSSTTVYSSVLADGNVITADEGNYFFAVEVNNIENANFETTFYAKPYAVTLDGTVVYDDSYALSVNQYLN